MEAQEGTSSSSTLYHLFDSAFIQRQLRREVVAIVVYQRHHSKCEFSFIIVVRRAIGNS